LPTRFDGPLVYEGFDPILVRRAKDGIRAVRL
jgi:hypothetical protein